MAVELPFNATDPILLLESPDSSQFKVQIENTGRVKTKKGADPAVPMMAACPPGYIDGGNLIYNTTSTVDISVGSVRDVDDTFDIIWTSPLTADITVSGANGLDTGSEAASTWYSVWAIAKSSDGTAASLLSVSATSPTMPSGYDKKRRLGWVKNTAASNFLPFLAVLMGGRSRVYQWDINSSVPEVLSAGTATSFTNIDLSGFIPATSRYAHLQIGRITTNSTQFTAFRTDGSTSDGELTMIRPKMTATTTFRMQTQIITSSSQIIEYEHSSSSGSTSVWVRGYQDEI